MALFLNTTRLNQWIPKLIQKSERELILIVPYIQTSDKIFESLKVADNKGIETFLIYRENKLSIKEKEKLLSLKNISLLHHPNIHCKCYFNGSLLIISSMNLYDYSQKNNREMGVLFSKESIEYEEQDKDSTYNVFDNSNDYNVFIDTIEEIRDIVNSSSAEKISDRAQSSSFEIDIIKTNEELQIEYCNELNTYFLNKKFKPYEDSKNVWFSRCNNFFEKIDVIFHHHRIAIKINLNDDELKKLHNKWSMTYNEFEFKGFKYYWNYYSSDILVYRDNRYDWESLKQDNSMKYKKINQVISLIINKYRNLTGK